MIDRHICLLGDVEFHSMPGTRLLGMRWTLIVAREFVQMHHCLCWQGGLGLRLYLHELRLLNNKVRLGSLLAWLASWTLPRIHL
mmetsp:Transcript_130599/g.212658  ORF Transcript_130599/g.212658 Transcript_130599/m.212658 type:complete len:84 (+) Transcript_130599:237-488(+)